MLRGGNMWFRPAIFIWLVFAQSFFKFLRNGDIRKLKAWSFRLRKKDFCRLYNERARALQSSITFFLIHPVYFAPFIIEMKRKTLPLLKIIISKTKVAIFAEKSLLATEKQDKVQ